MIMIKIRKVNKARTGVDELNSCAPVLLTSGRGQWVVLLAKAYQNLSLLIAGMYTGLNCTGTPRALINHEEDSAANTRIHRPI
jgi:hypothetical protein